MKRIATFLLAIMFVVSMAPTAFAESTTLTTTVPSATYTLNIPADQEIVYGSYETKIGNVTVTEGKNFATGKNVAVTLNYAPFASENTTTTIPYTLDGYGILNRSENTYASTRLSNNATITFKGLSSGAVQEKAYINCTLSTGQSYSLAMEYINVVVNSASWGQAAAGNYSSVITFSSEIVVE